MSRDNHHITKKKGYSVILIPDEDASKAKNFRLALWQVIVILSLFAIVSAVIVLLTFSYTPVGDLLPLSNPRLENKYSKELISINSKMMRMMENLVELRAYNIKLRQALGESVSFNDSSDSKILPKVSETEKNLYQSTKNESQTSRLFGINQSGGVVRQVNYEKSNRVPVSFPAILPVDGYITRGFEPTKNHFGLDIAGKVGSVIKAAADGSVIYSGWTYDYGFMVILSHANGFLTFYKHNQSLLKSAGAVVYRGEPIATLGNSGIISSGPHLHFEVWKDGVSVDPSLYMINYYF